MFAVKGNQTNISIITFYLFIYLFIYLLEIQSFPER